MADPISIENEPTIIHDSLFKTIITDYSNQWGMIFLLLSFEILLCMILILPIPVRWRINISQKMAAVWNKNPRFRIVLKTFIAIISALFVDSLRQMYAIHVSSYEPDLLKVGRQAEINESLLVSQRNAYLSGFTVFVFMILYRFQSMADQVAQLESKLDEIEPGLSKRTEHHVKKTVDYKTGKEDIQNNTQLSPVNEVKITKRN